MSAWRRQQGQRAGWYFLLPAAALLLLFVVWPLLRAFWWSLNATDLLALQRQHWVGAGQYSALLRDERFRQAFGNTALFALMVVPVQTALAFGLALWVTRPEREWRWLRAVFVLPTMVAMPALAVSWTALYQAGEGGASGPINSLLQALGMAPHAWLREPGLALPALAVMSVWQGVGLQLMVFVSALQALPRELLEAAKLDGAKAWQRTWYITMPALRNTFVFLLSVTTILAFRLFVQPYLMTRGGPMNSTVSVIQLIYETTFVAQDLGLACAAAFLFLAIVVVLTAVQRWAIREERT